MNKIKDKTSNSKFISDEKSEPLIGFKMKLYESTENEVKLDVILISARNLPKDFGNKIIKSIQANVKILPSKSQQFDSTIRPISSPLFNEAFVFTLSSNSENGNLSTFSLTDNVFNGQFVVFTLTALCESPNEVNTSSIENNNARLSTSSNRSSSSREFNRKIGIATHSFTTREFLKNQELGIFETKEIWLPLKSSIINSPPKNPKGEIELILEAYDPIIDDNENGIEDQVATEGSLCCPFFKRDKTKFYFKVTTSRFRCSINAKEFYEKETDKIYLKTKVFKSNKLLDSWKSDMFEPKLDAKWDPKDPNSSIIIPVSNENDMNSISVRTEVAIKTNSGKKIVLAKVELNSKNRISVEEWTLMMMSYNNPVIKWYSFE